ncbi:Type 2A phosphatase-associated protein 42 [Sorochytrium milnesiophthora]
MAMASTSPAALFQEVLASYESLSDTDVPNALRTLDECSALVHRLRLFSDNEELADISTRDLLLLLVDAYRASLQQRVRTKEPAERKAVVLAAKAKYEQFLRLCEDYGLVDDMDQNFLKLATGQASLSADQKRTLKIQRLKANKATESSLSALHDALVRQQAKVRKPTISTSALAALSTSFTPSSATSSQAREDVDEDEELLSRDFVLLLVRKWVHTAVEDVVSLSDELPHIEHMMQMQAQRQREPAAAGADATERVDMPRQSSFPRDGPLLDKSGRPMRPFTLVSNDKARQLREQVFQPGHRLPTMTVDQYLQAEAEQGNILTGGGNKSEQDEKSEIDDNDYQAIEEAMYKARMFDDFKDGEYNSDVKHIGCKSDATSETRCSVRADLLDNGPPPDLQQSPQYVVPVMEHHGTATDESDLSPDELAAATAAWLRDHGMSHNDDYRVDLDVDLTRLFTVPMRHANHQCDCTRAPQPGEEGIQITVEQQRPYWCACQEVDPKRDLLRAFIQQMYGSCPKLSYGLMQPKVSSDDDDTTSQKAVLQGYTHPSVAFQTALLPNGTGVSAVRGGSLVAPNIRLLHRVGFKTARSVSIDPDTLGFCIYTSVRFRQGKQTAADCQVERGAVSIFYGKSHVFAPDQLPYDRWVPITAAGKRSKYGSEPQPIIVQLSFTYYDVPQCYDALRLDLKHLAVCESTIRASSGVANPHLDAAENTLFAFQGGY